jgi:citrate synthase
MTRDSAWLSAAEATRELGIKRETLYAYVSRGAIRSTPKGGRTRERVYAREDVERARQRADERRDPSGIAAHALSHGSPVLESAISLITGGRLYYRGQDAVELARTRSVRDIAAWIWRGRFESLGEPPSRSRVPAVKPELPVLTRAQMLLAVVAATDPLAFDLRPETINATGARILDLMTYAASALRASPGAIENELVAAWKLPRRAAELLRSTIILCADHELNVSAFTARCVASAAGSPYGAVIAGLAALEGVRHGGMTARVESMLQSMRRERRASEALGARIREGATIDGFGHPLYPAGDPRAAEILRQLRELYPRSPELTFALDVADAAKTSLGQHPTVDFALATLSLVLRLPPRSALTLFAIGRTIGWIGHAIEQYSAGQLIRPRAKYIGPHPSGLPSSFRDY